MTTSMSLTVANHPLTTTEVTEDHDELLATWQEAIADVIEGGKVEVLNGQVIVTPAPHVGQHGGQILFITRWIQTHLPAGFDAHGDGIAIAKDREGRSPYIQPDITVVHRQFIQLDVNVLLGSEVTIIGEICSPRQYGINYLRSKQARAEQYGIPALFVINPKTETVTWSGPQIPDWAPDFTYGCWMPTT